MNKSVPLWVTSLLLVANGVFAYRLEAATYTLVTDRSVPWTQTVTLPEFAPDSKLLAHVRIISNGDPWDRTGRVWVQTAAGKVDLVPLTTGFGGTYWNDSVDVSALRNLLTGSVQFGGTVDQNSGWKMTVTLEEIAAGNTSKKAIWAVKSITSGTVWTDGQGDLGPKAYGFTIPNWPAALFNKVYLTFFVSGHGGSDGTGCCEFHTGTFRLWADGTTVLTADPWRAASDDLRSRNPTSGRWDGNGDGDTTDPYPTDYWSSDFNRSGWLPGDYVHPYVIDLTSALTNGIPGSHTISYDYLDNIGANGGYWILSSYVSATLSSSAPLATTTIIESSANPSGAGNNVTFTATVKVSGVTAGNATGSVIFKDGTTRLSTNAVSGGVATFTTSSLSPGAHLMTAEFSGTPGIYQASTSTVLAQNVQTTTATATGFGASPNPSAVGSNVTFTASVLVNGQVVPGAGGSMVFKDGTTSLSTNAVSGGMALFTTDTQALGSHLMRAEYSGYGPYLASTSAPVAHMVQPPTATTTVLSSLPNPSVAGSDVTFTATVTPSWASGSVVFKEDGEAISTNAVEGGVATFTTSEFGIGSYLMTAEYTGYGPYLASTSVPLAQVVRPPLPETPPRLDWTIISNRLTLNWPLEYLGWILQTQTNTLGPGINWTDIAGSEGVISTNLPFLPENPPTFFRLRSP